MLLALLVAEDYGPTWDCASGDYAYGEAIWSAIGDGAVSADVRAARGAYAGVGRGGGGGGHGTRTGADDVGLSISCHTCH